MMIQEHTLNVEQSKDLFEKNKDIIKAKRCYLNVFDLIARNRDRFHSGEWNIAYGYVTAHENLMARHCFIVDREGNAIDPTLPVLTNWKEGKGRRHISFVILETSKYLSLLSKNKGLPELDRTFKTEETEAWDWAMKQGIILLDNRFAKF